MPNIELHGLKCLPDYFERFHEIKKQLTKNLTPAFKKEIVITTYDSICADLKGDFQPFIRIISTDRDELSLLEGILVFLGYDIETLQIDTFYSRSSQELTRVE